MYGLEAIGFFNSQQGEINNSPQQTFSDVAPGDVKYKDQNGDNRIDEKDVVKMFGSSVPRSISVQSELLIQELELPLISRGNDQMESLFLIAQQSAL